MNRELKQFNINIEDIKQSDELERCIHEAINKMYEYDLTSRFEVVLNENLIEALDKYTGFRTIFGCRISYDNLPKDISFVVRNDNKLSYEDLQQERDKYKSIVEGLDKWFKSDEFIPTPTNHVPIEIQNFINDIENKIKELEEGDSNEEN